MATHIILVNGAAGNFRNRVSVDLEFDLLACSVETWTGDSLDWYRILSLLVSAAESQVTETPGELVDSFNFIHDGKSNAR